jgi:phospholipid/cholesterol/gamma-HCH transport system permease protein
MALTMFQQERWAGFGVGIALAQDLAPVFSALMITARAGSGMATELGSMRVTEQIDALVTFAVNPVQYLVTPRVVATILMLPVMTMVFNVVGLVGGYVVTVIQFHVDFGQLAALFRYWVDPIDYVKGIIKAAVFGLALSLAACYQGFNVRGGAKEVGRATTRAVVTGSVSILVLDLLPHQHPAGHLAVPQVSPGRSFPR